MQEIRESIRRAISSAANYEEQKLRLKNIAEVYELSFRQVVAMASSWFGEDYKKAVYQKKSSISKEELISEIASKLDLDIDLCDSLSKVNKGILIRINDRLI